MPSIKKCFQRLKKVVRLTLLSIVLATQMTIAAAVSYGPFQYSSNTPETLFLIGPIESFDTFDFRKALRKHTIKRIVLSSPGGNVWEALNIAAIIHDNKIDTYVPDLGNNTGCYSACAFLFFAGNGRHSEGNLGVHQFGNYRSDPSETSQTAATQQATQYTVSEVIGYLNLFEVPDFVYEVMFQSRSMYVFSQKELDLLERNKTSLSRKKKRELKNFLNEITTKRTQLVEKKSLSIQEVQKLLNRFNCQAGTADGILGPKTQTAIRKFQEINSLTLGSELPFGQELQATLTSGKAQKCKLAPRPKKTLKIIEHKFYKDYLTGCDGNFSEVFGMKARLQTYDATSGTAVFKGFTNELNLILGGQSNDVLYFSSNSKEVKYQGRLGTYETDPGGMISKIQIPIKKQGCFFIEYKPR